MEVCTIGEKCYWNSCLSGLLKCKVIDILPDNQLTIQITSTSNRTWRKGEKYTTSTLWIIPRRFYHKTGIFTFSVYPDYIWQKGEY